MVVFAANITEDTVSLLDAVLKNDEWVKFSLHTKLNLSDKTILIRLALQNILKHMPDADDVLADKAALLRPQEFDDFLKEEVRG